MWGRLGKILRSVGACTLGVCLIAVSGVPAGAQEDLPSFATRLLDWPKIELDDEREPESEQEREEFIETDRNSFTFAPLTPGDGRLIIESAYSYINIGQRRGQAQLPRDGVPLRDRRSARAAARLQLRDRPCLQVAEGDIAGNFGINAEQQILYGFKYAVTRRGPNSAFMPHSAFLAQLHTPVGSVEGHTQIRLGYAWGWILPNGWTFDQAVRFGTDREGTTSTHSGHLPPSCGSLSAARSAGSRTSSTSGS